MSRGARITFAGPRFLAVLLFSWMVCIGFLLAGPAHAQGTGRSLDIQPGARQNGMGAAGVALIGDPSEAVWWNPAALGFSHEFSGQFTYAKLLPGLTNDVRYYNGAGVMPLGSRGGLALGLTYLSYGKTSGGLFGPSFTANELSPAASAGFRVLPNLSFGATLKWIRFKPSSGSGATSNTVAFDLGALYRAPFERWGVSLGAAVQNLGPEVRFTNEDQSSPLGRNLKVGAAMEVPTSLGEQLRAGTVVVGDFNQSLVTEEFRVWNGGMEEYLEYERILRVAGRVGYYYDREGDIRDFTFGVGGRIFIVAVDAGWIPQARDTGLDRVLKLTAGIHLEYLNAASGAGSAH